jgi:phenylalanyl-tRNA synthetase beta chain
MKFSVNWLREFVELPGDVHELADLLTFAGVEIEGVEHRGTDIPNVVVAHINSFTQHPNADRLSVCDVDDGTNHHRQIVCGAKNFKAGDNVLVALPGAALPNGLKIKVSKLRGVESQGMLCSPSELHLSDDSDGLLILSPDAQVGTRIGQLFPADTILDVEITPNRADLLSYVGLAREIAALSGKALRTGGPGSVPSRVSESRLDDTEVVPPRIDALRECPFYSVRRIDNVTVGASPDWLRAKLEAAGLRPINNIVDITNFVMLELGQPLHAFDADKLQGGINVRLAAEGEKFLALDGRTYSLRSDMLIISDDARAVAIGGVMGGEDTGVTETTRNVLLESAYFLPSSIRRTARALNLPSDASYRFERGVNPAMTLPASARAAELIREIAGGTPAGSAAVAGEVPALPSDVSLRFGRCDRLLGVRVPREQIVDTLTRFGLHQISEIEDGATFSVPPHRPDLKREVDLIEEVVRQYGINKIPGANRSVFTPISDADLSYNFEARVRQRLIARGFSEARTSALIPRETDQFGEGAVELRNPLSEDHVALRPSLLPGLLGVLERNIRAGAQSLRLFELGRTFASPNADEHRHLALLCCGSVASAVHWRAGERRQLDFFDLKGAVESVSPGTLSFRRTERAGVVFAAEISANGAPIGFAGQLGSAVSSKLGAAAPVFVLEVELPETRGAGSGSAKFRELNKFPSITRDIAMIVPEALTHTEIEAVILSGKEPLLAGAELFDLFSGKGAENIGSERKSMAYTLTYRSPDRTLTNDEVTVVHTRIRERLKSELGAELRE